MALNEPQSLQMILNGVSTRRLKVLAPLEHSRERTKLPKFLSFSLYLRLRRMWMTGPLEGIARKTDFFKVSKAVRTHHLLRNKASQSANEIGVELATWSLEYEVKVVPNDRLLVNSDMKALALNQDDFLNLFFVIWIQEGMGTHRPRGAKNQVHRLATGEDPL